MTFSVSDFNQDVVNLGKSSSKTSAVGDTLANYAKYLSYRIYNAAGVLVNSIDQTSSGATFGSVSDRLPAGTYSAFLAASKSYLFASGTGTNLPSAYFQSSPWDDTYYKRIDFTVATSNISQAIRLDRVVGGLEITLQDAIPTNVNKISIIYQTEAAGLYLTNKNNFYTESRTIDFPLTAADKGKTNSKYFAYIGNVNSSSSVVIRAYDAANGLISEKTVNNVRCYANQKTLLTGTLFGSTSTNPSSSFTVTVNPTWGPSGTPITF